MNGIEATGRIVINLFTTLDGVAQAPGGPEEDTSGGFRFGGWQAPFEDTIVGEDVMRGLTRVEALLLGRRTYDIFSSYWPLHTDNPVGERYEAIPKYVATRNQSLELPWRDSTRVGGDLAAEITTIRARHRETHVWGSIDFVQTQLAEHLFDELHLWVYPIVLGEGLKVFPRGATPARLQLIEPAMTSESGATLLRYAPLPGQPETGPMGE